jgi:hypothetical protein
VVGLIATAELCCNLILEPWLYGQSAGVSQVALLVAVAFWTWLWGPVGLLVATPLTVCLVVVGRHVPELEFLSVLLTDEEPLDVHQRLYQRLLAGDVDEAKQIVDEFLALSPSERLYDELLIPVLVRSRADRERQRLSTEDEERVLHAARALLDELRTAPAAERDSDSEPGPPSAAPPIRVSTFAAAGAADLLAASMLRDLACAESVEFTGPLVPFRADLASTSAAPAVACIVATSRDGLRPARRLARKLRRRAPETTVVVVAWRGLPEPASSRPAESSDAPTAVVGSLLEARDRIWRCGDVAEHENSTTAL